VIDTAALREKVLDLAIRGKLVPQDPNDEPASVLLERIRQQKQQMVKDGKLKPKDIKGDTVIFVGDDNLHYEKFPDGTLKCIEDEIPFDLPNGWVWCRLSQTIMLYSGQDLIPSRYNDEGKGIPYITGASNLENKRVIINRWTETPTTHASKGDLLLTCKGSGVGKMAWCDIDDAHIARQIMALRCVKGLHPEYLELLMSAMITSIKEKANGLIPGLSRDMILDILSPIPPASEQERIVQGVTSIVLLIDQMDHSKAEFLDAIRCTKSRILDLAIRGRLVPQDPEDEPASVLLERIRAEKEELIKQGKIKRDKKESVIFRGEDNSYYLRTGEQIEDISPWELFDLPTTWSVCALGEVCDYGKCINVETDQICDDEWILDLEDIEKDSGIVLCKIRKSERSAVSTKHRFTKGQVLYSKLRPYLNKVVLADEDGYCTSEILPLDFASIIVPAYARYYLMSPTFLKYADRCSFGVKMPRLSTSDGKKAVLPIPPIKEQVRIVEAIECAFAQLDSIAESLK